MHALVVSYALRDATPGEHAELCEQLAPAVAAVRGLDSTTWLANPVTGRFGAFFVFATKPDFDRFVASELFETISSHGSIHHLTASDYSISDRPTAVTHGPVSSADTTATVAAGTT
jgi:Putative mono-oxygenase ydhR